MIFRPIFTLFYNFSSSSFGWVLIPFGRFLLIFFQFPTSFFLEKLQGLLGSSWSPWSWAAWLYPKTPHGGFRAFSRPFFGGSFKVSKVSNLGDVIKKRPGLVQMISLSLFKKGGDFLQKPCESLAERFWEPGMRQNFLNVTKWGAF